MLLNYIKIAVRNIIRSRFHSFINIIGLSIGLTCTILILLFVLDELSYDMHNSKHDRLYIAKSTLKINGQESSHIGSSYPLGPTLEREYPVVEKTARAYMSGSKLFLDKDNRIIRENRVYYAETRLFEILDHDFIYGSSEKALDSPHTIVLSKTLSKKYFGDQNPVGMTISAQNGIDYTVKGVFKDLPRTTSIRYEGLITMLDYPDEIGPARFRMSSMDFTSFDITTFILLKKKADVKTLKEDYSRFRKKYISLSHYGNAFDLDLDYELLSDYRLHDKITENLKFTRLERVYFLTALALLILLMACINYMNLATARSMGRAREVGIRKALGADRVSIMRQFLCESVLITLSALLIAIAMAELLLPYFNDLAFKELSLGGTGSIRLFFSIIIITLATGIIAGSYPALFMSSFMPVKVLAKIPRSGTGKGMLRKSLVVTQYSISIIMIICMMLSIKQMNYIKNIDLGFDRKNVFFILFGNEESRRLIPALKETLSGHSGITAAARSSFILPGLNSVTGIPPYKCKIEDDRGNLVEKQACIEKVDLNYIDLMDIKVIEGRSFEKDSGADLAGSVLINETFAKTMGWNDTSIGKRVTVDGSRHYLSYGEGGYSRSFDGNYNVIGVIKDIRFDTLYKKIVPLIILPVTPTNTEGIDILTLKINPAAEEETLKFVRQKMLDIYPSVRFPMIMLSLEEQFDNNYQTEKMVNRLLTWAALLCVIISCLGFLGLSSFIAENKTKEIGIRKVNGASVRGIVFSLTLQFLKPVLISSIIACPTAYFLMSRWFENFANRTGMGPWIFISGIAAAVIIAWFTVCFHSIKAAMTDPVKALRYE